MKKIVLGMAMLMAAGAASAENSHQMGKLALGVNTNFFEPVDQASAMIGGDMITGKYMLSNNLALTGGVAFATYGSDAEGTDLAFRVGARNYLSSGDFSPFVGGRFGYGSYMDGNLETIEFAAEFGAEYFLSRQFSVEGAASFGYSSTDTTTQETVVIFGVPQTVEVESTVSRLGTSQAGIQFNFYF